MLNNDFNVLVQKYERYKKQKSKSRNRMMLFLIMIGALGYYISTLNFTQLSDKEKNITAAQTQNIDTSNIPALNTTVKDKNISKDINSSEKETSKILKNNKKSTLKVTTKENSLSQLLANQAQSKSYSSTIAVANFHYSKKSYQKAIKWSIEASKKNNSKERPWIVYAKSKKALGKEAIAKKALTLFLKKHPSKEAVELLNTL